VIEENLWSESIKKFELNPLLASMVTRPA